ncbi:MAG: penicillin-binding protein 2 [Cellvibrionaceae bacterium]|nr:penicillin-binding protein 2 [Cellvibrionaceae bacterium]
MKRANSKTVKKARPQKRSGPVALQSWRFYLALLVLLLVAAALVWHLALLQVVPGNDRGYEFLQGQGDARTVRNETIKAYRGVITDRNGEPLAVSSPLTSLWTNPALMRTEEARQHWPRLAKALGMKKSDLAARFELYANKGFMYLKRYMPPQEAQPILDLKIPGVYQQTEYQRFYPAAEVAAHLIGFTDKNGSGSEGLELAYDTWLRGEDGAKRVIKDLKGRVIEEEGLVRAARSGKDVRLSIDLRLQYMAYRELKTALKAYQAKAGSVVILDVASGEVLAMVNQPSYNPNDRRKLKSSQLRNRAMVDIYEPGSTMKPLTVLAALETGRYFPATKIETSPGYYRVRGKTFVDPVNYGEVDLTKIITKSSQVGIVKVALDLDPDKVRDTFARFGLGASTGSGFPGERSGILPSRPKWHDTERANLSFGYGMNLTAVQLAQAYNVFANDGVLRPVSMLHNQEGIEASRVADAKYVAQVRNMLKTVTEKGGTGTLAQGPDYPVAGKTGTVHKLGKGGYAENRYMSLFAGMAPADKPEIVAVVMIDEPGTQAYSGGKVAAPVFGRITEAALRLLRVPPQLAAAAEGQGGDSNG